MAPPDEQDLSKEVGQIAQVAQKEAEPPKKKQGRKTKEEEQLFGHRRQTRLIWHCIKITYLIVFAVVVLLAIISLFWNWFAPPRFRWLSSDQVADAQKFLFSGTIGGLLTAGVKAALSKPRDLD